MGAREGESPIVPGPCRTTRRCLRVGLFGMQPQSGGKFHPRLNMGERPIANNGWGPAIRPGRMRNRAIHMRLTACLGICVLRASAFGLPIRPVLKHRPSVTSRILNRIIGTAMVQGNNNKSSASRDVADISGKQNWRCGMNRNPGYGAQLRANLEPTKGVGRLRQQDALMRELRIGIQLKFQNRDVAVDDNVSKGNNLWSMEQYRQGKSAKWIRNFGKRIGSEGWARGSQFRTRRLLAGCLSC
ncbi:unnamed protein product [Brassica rapa subsp. narinosa]